MFVRCLTVVMVFVVEVAEDLMKVVLDVNVVVDQMIFGVDVVECLVGCPEQCWWFIYPS